MIAPLLNKINMAYVAHLNCVKCVYLDNYRLQKTRAGNHPGGCMCVCVWKKDSVCICLTD